MSTVLLTGASGGLGRAIARELVRDGFKVALVARRPEPLQELAAELAAEGRARAFPADVAVPEAVEEAVSEAARWGGSLEAVVHAAGEVWVGSLEETPPSIWRRILDGHLTGAYLVSRAALPHLRPGGTLLFVGSIASRRGFPGWSAYCAAKHGLAGLAAALREELRPRGIRVGLLLPGAVDTPLWDRVPGSWDRTRMLRPETVAGAVRAMLRAPEDGAWEELTLLPRAGTL